ncbi:calcium activated cation channel [Wolfiporia cocos MD-104 SS10]|uniref:Calcium activated cation channel n=1 Tax=Wolfiporia cocos (strain MD-104) TaxID=742152 RepID=A0A2H3JH53_WOLCO|nr:calcium activated cation channel [Wolfiporia cocos MD-104 SS10]
MSRRDANGGGEDSEHSSLFHSVNAHHPSPVTVTNLIRRVRALTLRLLPMEVPQASIIDPTSRVIPPQVVDAYMVAAGDFLEALPYCLIRAHEQFLWDASHDPADWGENFGRAVACEVLARRVIHEAPPDKILPMMSTRYRYKENDGRISEKASVLEVATDSHSTIFLSSTEAQDVVNYLWRGQIILKLGDDNDVDFVPYKQYGYNSFWTHLDPGRLSVPRYQNIFRIVVWIVFLLAYSQAIREPLNKLDPDHADLDTWEIIMYILALSFSFENMHKIYKLFFFVSWRSLGFWDVVSFVTDLLLSAAFVLRVAGVASPEPRSYNLRIWSFQCLSFVAPLIWMQVIPIFDGFQSVGTMQICVARMLQESGIFCGLLAILGIGFMQGLYALDAADGQADHPHEVVHVLIQALLQAPNYEMFAGSSAGQILFYLWNVVTAVILLNVLISLFSSAYNDVVEDAAAEYLTYFAGKMGGMIRAPDEYVYPAPFNIIEILLIAPFEFIVSEETYATINHYVMLTIFFIPLSLIALYEAELEPSRNRWVKDWISHPDEGAEDSPEFQDPPVHEDDAARGLEISRVKFDDVVKAFPDMKHSSEAVLLREVRQLKDQIEELKLLLAAQR